MLDGFVGAERRSPELVSGSGDGLEASDFRIGAAFNVSSVWFLILLYGLHFITFPRV